MAHTPEPWIWLQEHEASGEAHCGCRLDSAGPDGTAGAAFYLCPKHDAAPDLLAALTTVLAHLDELADAWRRGALTELDGLGGTRSNRNMDCVHEARATIAKTKI